MSKKFGVTEQYWRSAEPEFKLYWGFARHSLVWSLGVLVVTKTGNFAADAIVALLTGGLSLLVTAGQRELSLYKPGLRRRVTRYSIHITLLAVVVLGASVYLSMVYLLCRGVVASLPELSVTHTFERSHSVHYPSGGAELMSSISFAYARVWDVIVIASLGVASFKSFRGLELEELIYRAPKRGLVKYLARRRFIATDLQSFVAFEVAVIFASVWFSSGAVMVFNLLMSSPVSR